MRYEIKKNINIIIAIVLVVSFVFGGCYFYKYRKLSEQIGAREREYELINSQYELTIDGLKDALRRAEDRNTKLTGKIDDIRDTSKAIEQSLSRNINTVSELRELFEEVRKKYNYMENIINSFYVNNSNSGCDTYTIN